MHFRRLAFALLGRRKQRRHGALDGHLVVWTGAVVLRVRRVEHVLVRALLAELQDLTLQIIEASPPQEERRDANDMARAAIERLIKSKS